MEHRFKVGDKVRRIHSSNGHVKVGSEHTVAEVKKDVIRLNFGGSWYDSDNFELVINSDAVGPFRAGDKVRRIKSSSDTIKVGDERFVAESNGYVIRLEFEDVWRDPDYFELVAPAVKTNPFKTGDKVRRTKNPFSGMELGGEHTVAKVWNRSLWLVGHNAWHDADNFELVTFSAKPNPFEDLQAGDIVRRKIGDDIPHLGIRGGDTCIVSRIVDGKYGGVVLEGYEGRRFNTSFFELVLRPQRWARGQKKDSPATSTPSNPATKGEYVLQMNGEPEETVTPQGNQEVNSPEDFAFIAGMMGSIKHETKPTPFDVPGYGALSHVLKKAYDQSARGKGKSRHNTSGEQPFIEQPIMEIGRRVGTGYPAGQAIKKLQESIGMSKRGSPSVEDDFGAAKAEALGAIVYCAAYYLLLEEELQKHE